MIIYLFTYLEILRIKPKALNMLGKHSTAELYHQPLKYFKHILNPSLMPLSGCCVKTMYLGKVEKGGYAGGHWRKRDIIMMVRET